MKILSINMDIMRNFSQSYSNSISSIILKTIAITAVIFLAFYSGVFIGKLSSINNKPIHKGAPFPIVIEKMDVTLKIYPDEKIEKLKEIIKGITEISVNKIRLSFQGQELDDQKTLRDYTLSRGSILEMSIS